MLHEAVARTWFMVPPFSGTHINPGALWTDPYIVNTMGLFQKDRPKIAQESGGYRHAYSVE
jgi:hypothetical protein